MDPANEFEMACTCGQHMLVEAIYQGQEVQCPGCRGWLTVPAPPSHEEAVTVAPRPAHVPAPATGPRDITYAPTARANSGKAVACFVCGLLSLLLCPVVLSIVAFVLYAQAKQEIRTNPRMGGEGLATAGLILGLLGLLWPCLLCGGVLPGISLG